MMFEIEDELTRLENELKYESMKTDQANEFVEKMLYEDEYSHNEIYELQEEFIYYAEKYMRENYKGKYAIKQGVHSVAIITTELLNKRKLTGWTIC